MNDPTDDVAVQEATLNSVFLCLSTMQFVAGEDAEYRDSLKYMQERWSGTGDVEEWNKLRAQDRNFIHARDDINNCVAGHFMTLYSDYNESGDEKFRDALRRACNVIMEDPWWVSDCLPHGVKTIEGALEQVA
eukprot:TRINITY_DN10794_c0_g1_i1.p1 TRINITY_DN10794_c0_g1~~TRINITY_DN10794_c0_g1_i1.p1  ORF type:complete len:133 (+),score=6.09 TRINITY_DN10794_c0_g1_i1:61-459(+)